MNGVMSSQIGTFTEEDLENSPTFQKLAILSRVNPINTNNQAEVDSALASDLIVLVEALDNKTIRFDHKSDEGALFRLMLTAHSIVSQPRPTSPTHH
jgi:hypothetical protein